MNNDTPTKAESRHQLFLEHIRNSGFVWGLTYDGGWANWSSEEGEKLIPLWSDKSAADKCAQAMFKGYSVERIEQDFLLRELLPHLAELDIWVGTNLTSGLEGIDIPASELKRLLE